MIWALMAVLVMWAAITMVRRKTESSRRSAAQHDGAPRDPDIDYDELAEAERDVKDMDTDAKGRPLDDVIGDDWGPGTPKPPYT